MNGLDVEAYLADVIARIADHPIKRIDDLLLSTGTEVSLIVGA